MVQLEPRAAITSGGGRLAPNRSLSPLDIGRAVMASATSTPAATNVRSSRSASRRSATSDLHMSGVSPVCQTRTQEKDDLRHLNDRLANYIQWVQELESERASMLLQLEEKDESKTREMGKVRRLYEEELADVRSSLDEVAGEKARLQIDCGNLCEENKSLQVRWPV